MIGKMKDALKEGKDGTIIDIEVVPNSSEFRIEYNQWSKRIRIKIRSQALKGQANKEIQAIFKEIFRDATIIKGEHNRKKSILVSSDIEKVYSKISEIIK